MLFLPDSNILIQALRENSAAHDVCRKWLLKCVSSGHEIALAELVETSLLRITTHPRLGPLPTDQVIGYWLEDLWSYPATRRVGAGVRHAEIFKKLLLDHNLTGNGINDAWLAALAMEHRATLVSTDNGFSRFPGLKWLNPMAR